MHARVASRHGDASDATGEVVAAQVERGAGAVAWTTLDASGMAGVVRARARRVLGV
jgi:predicted kinase